MASGDTKTEALLRVLGHGGSYDGISGSGNTKTQDLLVDAIGRIQNVEDDVEGLKNNPDVVDIVNTYADLQAYDTSTLTDKDIIRVLEDSTHDNDGSYYRYNASSQSFTYIGSAGGGGPTVVQTIGTSTTDVMSQNATTSMVYADPGTNKKVQIGNSSNARGIEATAIGSYSSADNWGTAIGTGSSASGESVSAGRNAIASTLYSVAIGAGARVENVGNSVALGASASVTRKGEVNVGTGLQTTWGYNNTQYRVIGGVHDPVDAHDAATKGYVDANVNPTMFYAPFDIYQSQAGNVSIYLDESLTQAATGGDFYDAMAKYGQIIICAPPSYVDSDYHKIVSVSVHQPYEKSVTAFDSYPPEAYFAVVAGTGFASATLSFNSADVDDTVFSYYVNIS